MNSIATNRLTEMFELLVPIVQGPMGGVAGPELIAAVANAGALGILPIWTLSPEQVRAAVTATQSLTSRGFAVNVRADLQQQDQIQAAIDSGVAVVHSFWGDPGACAAQVKQAGARLLCTVGDAPSARAALDAGADALIAQGVEAGGHVRSEMPLEQLLEEVLTLAEGVPVVAAGGLATAEDVARVIALGAAGALLGTRFVATHESMAHDDYKQALIQAGAGSTVRSECFDIGWPDAPHRHIKNDTFLTWDSAGRPGPGARPGEGEVILAMGDVEIPRYAVMPPALGMTGAVHSAVLYAGTGVERIHNIASAAEVIAELISPPRG